MDESISPKPFLRMPFAGAKAWREQRQTTFERANVRAMNSVPIAKKHLMPNIQLYYPHLSFMVYF